MVREKRVRQKESGLLAISKTKGSSSGLLSGLQKRDRNKGNNLKDATPIPDLETLGE